MPPRIHHTCTLPGCSNPHYATGLCRGHYVARRSAAVRAASTAINAAPLAIVGGMTTAHRAAAMQAAQAVPAAPHLPNVPPPPRVPPAPVLTPPQAIPLPPTVYTGRSTIDAATLDKLPAPQYDAPAAPMLPIIPAPPVFPRSK